MPADSKVQLDVESTLSPVNLEAPVSIEYAQQFAFTRPPRTILRAFNVDPDTGLYHDEVSKRQAEYGPNELQDDSGVSYLAIFLRQVLNAMTMVCVSFLPFILTT